MSFAPLNQVVNHFSMGNLSEGFTASPSTSNSLPPLTSIEFGRKSSRLKNALHLCYYGIIFLRNFYYIPQSQLRKQTNKQTNKQKKQNKQTA